MRVGEYKVKFNYTILRGFIDAFGLLMAIVLYQTTSTYYNILAYPDQILNNLHPDGVPLEKWILGGIVPLIGVIVLALSIVYMFIPHRARRFKVTEKTAQKYYDYLMIACGLLRILALLAVWDYTYIIQSNLLYGNIFPLSFQAVMDAAVAVLVIYIVRTQIKKLTAGQSEKIEKTTAGENGRAIVKAAKTDEIKRS